MSYHNPGNTEVCSYLGLEPHFFEETFLENRELSCKLKPDAGKTLCPRHELLVATVGLIKPDRWQCRNCQHKFPYVKLGICTDCGHLGMKELPAEIPL